MDTSIKLKKEKCYFVEKHAKTIWHYDTLILLRNGKLIKAPTKVA